MTLTWKALQAKKSRERVTKHRRCKKLKKGYDDAVRNDIQRKLKMQQKQKSNNILNDDSPQYIEDLHHDEPFKFKEELKMWAVKHNITKRAINDLLQILVLSGFNLPKDSRTLLETPTHVDIKQLSIGNLWYQGVVTCLSSVFQYLNRDISIRLDFNFDGVPLFDSSKKTFWPILSSIRGKFIKLNCLYLQ